MLYAAVVEGSHSIAPEEKIVETATIEYPPNYEIKIVMRGVPLNSELTEFVGDLIWKKHRRMYGEQISETDD